jgi:hypothetical protein
MLLFKHEWKATTNEEQCDAEAASLERERLAFNRTDAAWITVQNQFEPFGN